MFSFSPARRLAAIAAVVALAAVPARAQQKLLTIDDLYDPVKRVNFGPPGFGGGYTWINDKEFIRLGGGPRGAQAGGRGDVMKVDAETGTESPLYDASKLEAALAKLPARWQGYLVRGLNESPLADRLRHEQAGGSAG